MNKYIFVYHGGEKLKSQEEGAEFMGKWRAWMACLGDAVIDPGAPVGMSKTVSANGVTDDGGSNPIAGITIVQAHDIDGAIEMAKTCPHVEIGNGTIEVAEAMDMEM